MQVYRHHLLALLLAVGVLIVSSLYSYLSYSNGMHILAENNKEIFLSLLNYAKTTTRRIVHVTFTDAINTPAVLSIMEEANSKDPAVQERARQKLYHHLLPIYDKLQSYGIRQLHFHLPDNRSFLRFHRPGKFGDDLTKIRYTVMVANRDKIYIEGFEEGKIFNGFRHVFPLFNREGRNLGSVELSVSYLVFAKDIHYATGAEIEFVIDKNISDKKLFSNERRNYALFPHSKSFYMDVAAKQKQYDVSLSAGLIKKNSKEVAALLDQKLLEPTCFYSSGACVGIYPVYNVESKIAGYFIAAKSSVVSRNLHETLVVQMVYGIILASAIGLLGYFWLQQYRQTREMAMHDHLTGLYNRHYVHEYISLLMERLKRREELAVSLIFLDIDNFKQVNDKWGHEVGDKVLQDLARLVSRTLRSEDVIVRWGGEEFLIVLETTDAGHACEVAEKLRKIIEEHRMPAIGHSSITCSFGVVRVDANLSLDENLDLADKKLYQAKVAGRNQVIC